MNSCIERAKSQLPIRARGRKSPLAGNNAFTETLLIRTPETLWQENFEAAGMRTGVPVFTAERAVTPIIKYNLACYCCQVGEIEKAKSYLKNAFEIDLTWRLQALGDEDLRPIWDSI